MMLCAIFGIFHDIFLSLERGNISRNLCLCEIWNIKGHIRAAPRNSSVGLTFSTKRHNAQGGCGIHSHRVLRGYHPLWLAANTTLHPETRKRGGKSAEWRWHGTNFLILHLSAEGWGELFLQRKKW